MRACFCSTNFGHKRGEFCQRVIMDQHFLSFFRTDYLYEKDGKMLRGRRGDMLIIPAGEVVYHGPTPEASEGFINDWLYVSGDDFLELACRHGLPIGEPFSVGGDSALARCIEKILKERAASEVCCEELSELYIREMLIKLRRAFECEAKAESYGKLHLLRQRLSEESGEEWTLSKMAEICGYSESRFSHLYKKHFGTSPINDLIDARLERAKMLLAYSTESISEISRAVGFASIYYFSKAFKKSSGQSPSEYRSRFIK